MDEGELTRWLDTHGLAACAQILIDNAVDLELLPDLSDQDLASIGLVLGLRRKLLKAAAGLRAEVPAATVESSPTPLHVGTPAPAGERRYVTVMFCDLVGSTRIAADMDAEEWRDLVAAYHATVAAAVEPLGGNVAQKMGDGAMVYFGYPQAHEDDAERAVRAGLGILQGLTELNRKLVSAGQPALEARVGLHSGPVVVDGGEFAFGDVPNVAARVQSAAEPGQVLISDAVHRHVAGLFIVEDRGAHRLKGVPEPVPLLQVVRASGASRRRAVGRAVTPFVGRDDESQLLRNRWERVQSGESRVVTLISDAGVGKSRLLDEFRATLAGTRHTWAEWSCAQLLQHTPFHPIVEWARQRFGGLDMPAERRFAEFEATLMALGLDPTEAVPALAPLFELALPARYPQPKMSPEEKRRAQLSVMASWVTAGAKTQPLVLDLEDAHWADPSTLELIGNLIDQDLRIPLLVLITARPEFRAPWPTRAHHEQFALAPLNERDASKVVRAMVAPRNWAAETIEIVVQRSGGVPLFLEEVTRLLIEGSGDVGGHEIPPTLHASLLARLDRLGTAKEIAQIGAVIGREFDWRLLFALAGTDHNVLNAALDNLCDADMIHAQRRPPEATYRFNQALLQEVAYDALLKSRRRELHAAVARSLTGTFPDLADARPELLAHHLTEAGDFEAAVAAWQRAGTAAMARGAFVEASTHFDHGIRLIKALPDTPQRASQEFKLRSALAQCFWACKGFGAVETRAAFEAALAIGETLDDMRTLATVLSGLVAALTQQAHFVEARVFANRLSALAQRTGSASFERGWATLRQAAVSFYLGELASARELFREVRRIGSEDTAAIGGVSLVGMAAIYRPWLAALTGEADDAQEYIEDGLGWSRQTGSPHDHAFALTGAVIADLHFRNVAAAAERLRVLLSVTEEHHLRVLRSSAVLFDAWATCQRGYPVEAVAKFEQGLHDYQAIGQKVLLNWFTALHAEAQAKAGDYDLALDTIERALNFNPLSPLYNPEVQRIKSEIMFAKARTLTGGAAEELVRDARNTLGIAAIEAGQMGLQLIAAQAAQLIV